MKRQSLVSYVMLLVIAYLIGGFAIFQSQGAFIPPTQAVPQRVWNNDMATFAATFVFEFIVLFFLVKALNKRS